MVKLTINQAQVEVPEGSTVMEAAALLGITIPSMCFRPRFSNHPSCMVCLVKDIDRNHLVPSCAMPVAEGMNILTDSNEVLEARREALELLLSDHVGDCEAPCRLSCPALMDIPLMNRLIASGDFDEALRIVRNEIALPLVLGYICPAPCEKACKRKPIDQAVSICLLKRSSAQFGGQKNSGLPEMLPCNGKKVAIVGAGPVGLSAAFHLLRSGHGCVLYDQHDKAGGAMQYDIPDNHLPKEMLDAEIGIIRQMGAEFHLGSLITREEFQHSIQPGFDAIILATGHQKSDPAETFGLHQNEHGAFVDKLNFTTSIPGVFACGLMVREQKMAVHSVSQGKLAAEQVSIYLGTCNDKTKKPTVSRSFPFHAEVAALDGKARQKSISTIGRLSEAEWGEYLKESIPDHQVEPVGGKLAGYTREEAMHEARRCLHCDCRKPASCKLRRYSEEYNADRRRFVAPERKAITRSVQHELVIYETEKCIRCGLCVDITGKHGESIGLTFAGRGFDVRISIPFNQTIKEALTRTAMECVAACPTGALAFKDQEERYS